MSRSSRQDRHHRVCVYCASSNRCDPRYRDDARALGAAFAQDDWHVIYGGGARGSMGALADGALSEGGHITGIIPNFMKELEWAHDSLTELTVVEDMRTRKHLMLSDSHAVVALPGGIGTFEELFETLTLKKLGIWSGPVVLLNTGGYFEALTALLERSIDEQFLEANHGDMWTVVDTVDQVIPALDETTRAQGPV